MKMNRLKKMLSVTLAAALLITSVPMGTYAGEPDTEESASTEASADSTGEIAATSENEVSAPTAAPSEDLSAGAENTGEPAAPAESTGISGDNSANQVSEETPEDPAGDVNEVSQNAENAEGAENTESKENTESEGDTESGASNQDIMNIMSNSGISQIAEGDSTVAVTWSGLVKEWNNGPQEPTATVSEGYEVELSYDGNSNLTDGKPQEPGKYTVTAKVTDPADPTKEIELQDGTATFTITKKSVTAEELDWGGFDFNNQSYTGKEIPVPKATFADITETLVDLTVTCNEGTIKDAKSYSLRVEIPADYASHYELASAGIAGIKTFVVKPCVLTVNWTKDTATYNGKPQTFEYTVNHSSTDATENIVTVVYTTEDEVEVRADDLKNVGTYTAKMSTADSNHQIAAGSETHEVKIEPCVVTLDWVDTEKEYTGAAQELPYEIKSHGCDDVFSKGNISVTYNTADGSLPKNAGVYTATAAVVNDGNHIIDQESQTRTLTINNRSGLTIAPTAKLTKQYDNAKTALGYALVWNKEPEDETVKSTLEAELKTLLDNAGGQPLTYGDVENVGTYPVAFADGVEQMLKDAGYDVSVAAAQFEITKRPVTITPVPGQGKYYGTTEDPTLKYTISDIEEGILKGTNVTEKEIQDAVNTTPLYREDGKKSTVGLYRIAFDGEPANFEVTLAEENFAIWPLPVTITPDENQEKIFGQIEPELYGYTLDFDKANTDLKKSDVRKELGAYVLERMPGEDVGSYGFYIKPDGTDQKKDPYKDLYKGTKFGNYDLKVADNAPEFRINKIRIEEVQAINSRQDSFTVTTNLTGAREPGVTTGFQVEIVEYPEEDGGVHYSDEIDDYIYYATRGIDFVGDSDTIYINEVQYSKERKDNKKFVRWNGYLPAGMTIAVSVVDAYGTVVSNSVNVKVTPVNVSFNWSGYATSAATGNYVVANNGKTNPLSLTGDRAGELVEIMYNGKAADYSALNLQFAPSVQNANSKHVAQSVTANIVDTLNLVCESKSLQFYVDDSAFAIPASSLRFENRGKELTIQLPEQGTLTAVSVLGGKVELPGSMGQEFTLPVSWSGKNLIPTGAPISVTYTDQAGHQGSGIAAVTRSAVSTPITFRIRPELNINGYLHGRDTLVVSGTACSCEPIRVTVAGMTQTTYSTQKEVWSDSNGSWEMLISMSSLPEGQDFTISAEYVDVSGSGYSMTAKYDAFCASASIISPVYEAMSYISGMVEPGTAVGLVLNGDSQNYYEIQVDRFGHFVMDDVPMMFGGEDSFDIYVRDIAGNLSIRHYEVEEPGDPFEVTGKVNPLGKFIYSASESDSVTYTATPVSAADFEDDKTSVELPLLFGMSYEVGTLTIGKTENGISVSKELKMNEEIAEEDYSLENEKLYVYTSRPSVEELRNATGQEVEYGAEIPLGEGETVWLVSESDMTILADDIMALDAFDFENSEEYVKYQEH